MTVGCLSVSLTEEKPKDNEAAGPCAGFPEARQAAIDALVAAIEDAERKLTACKRAASLDELRKL